MPDISSRVGILEEWRLKVADPKLDDQEERVDKLESFRDSTEGKFTVILWLNGLIVTLLVAMIIALFTWGLSHITLKVMNDSVSSKIQQSDKW